MISQIVLFGLYNRRMFVEKNTLATQMGNKQSKPNSPNDPRLVD